MEKQEIVQLLKEQLPALLEESPELERWIERLTAQRYANRQQTESRFDQLMEELRRDREEQSRKWEESKAESDRKWAEQTEQNRRLWLEVGEQKSRLDRKIGALGARWGIGSERAFRQANLAGWKSDQHSQPPDGFPVTIRPDWVCEVCHTTRKKDRELVPDTLSKAGVPYYWFVDAEELFLEVWELQVDKSWKIINW